MDVAELKAEIQRIAWTTDPKERDRLRVLKRKLYRRVRPDNRHRVCVCGVGMTDKTCRWSDKPRTLNSVRSVRSLKMAAAGR